MAMTKKEMFATIRTLLADNAEVVQFCDHEIELLARKSSGSRKPTKTQSENEGYKQLICSLLAECNYPMTIADIQNKDAELAALTGQRISALLSQLRKSGEVVRTYDKKKAYFTIGEGVADAPEA